jgi:serine phosphatase RsbU (regulator of sigma subunit)
MTPRRPLLALAAGAAVLAGGWALARAVLPEWRAGELPDRARAAERAAEVAAAAGLTAGGVPRLRVDEVGGETLGAACETLGAAAPGELAAAGRGLAITVTRPAHWAGGPPGTATVQLSARGEPIAASWMPAEVGEFLGFEAATADPTPVAEALARQLLRPGETLGPATETRYFNTELTLSPILGADPPEVLVHQRPPGSTTIETRWVGDVAAVRRHVERLGFRRLLFASAPPVLLFTGAAVLFVVLLGRRRLGIRHGAALAAAALVSSAASALRAADEPVTLVFSLIAALFAALFVLFAWSAAESLARSAELGFTTSLDALGRLRLGPRGGRGLAYGWAAGAALAGSTLGVWALLARWPALAPRGSSVDLPAFAPGANPLVVGPSRAALALLALAAATRLLPARWRLPAAALAAGLAITPLPLEPLLARRAAGVLAALALLAIFRRWGLTALLAAAVTAAALPPALLALQHPGWLGATLAGAGGLALALPVLGVIGLGRPAAVETAPLEGPAFVRRLERERRLQYEMDLLARIQLGLLPAALPVLPGYRFAARTALATEAGGDLYDFFRDERGHLWVAVGDVSGHGYSCAIAHAMVKSALVSLIAAERTPAEILLRIDRVLRAGAADSAGGAARQFTSLALLRLDPASGRGLFANAGHPYPLLLAAGGAEEVAAPGLPLGQGPDRTYRDRPVELPPGGALLFFSDGLVEALDDRGAAYGFRRPADAARGAGAAGDADADAILESVLADWRRWVGRGEVLDDTTVVVVCRGAVS